MDERTWVAVDEYFGSLREDDPVLNAALERSREAGLPDIAVSPEQGRMLTVLARGVRARTVLEIGTLGGYSAIWLARALPPDGHLITLEHNDGHAAVARANLASAGFETQAQVMVGNAVESLEALQDTHAGGFDLVFIDADKEGYPVYWSWALRLSHPGTLIIADNVVRKGDVTDGESADPQTRGVREYLRLAATEPRVADASIQTVGAKGHDGFSVAVVT